ncbi:hypothetical protein [Desulfovibrio sp. Huiquan2017]|uniref:hypothetical protein n=1 Tax=Desulfovibrio sp. Huiquan2017 TaxID=2816861 RepID=UPI001A93819E|nr:hypothetical protein [Desulfovibrio sp. Huiquan2017]
MDDFDQVKMFMNDWLKRFLKGNEHIASNNLATPSPHTQYVPGYTAKGIGRLKDLMVSKDYATMRNCILMAAEDGAFGPPDSLPCPASSRTNASRHLLSTIASSATVPKAIPHLKKPFCRLNLRLHSHRNPSSNPAFRSP